MNQDRNDVVEAQATSNEDRLTVEIPTDIQAGAAGYGCTVYSCSSVSALAFEHAVLPALIARGG